MIYLYDKFTYMVFRHVSSLVRVSRVDFLQGARRFPNKEVGRFSTEKSTTSRFFTLLIPLFCVGNISLKRGARAILLAISENRHESIFWHNTMVLNVVPLFISNGKDQQVL